MSAFFCWFSLEWNRKTSNVLLYSWFLRKPTHSVINYYNNVQPLVFWSRETEIMKSQPQDGYILYIHRRWITQEAKKKSCFFFTGFLKWNWCYCVHFRAELHVYIRTSSLKAVPRGSINDHWLVIAIYRHESSMCLSVFDIATRLLTHALDIVFPNRN